MKLKRILIIVVSVFALIIAAGYFLLTKFLKAAGEECDVKIIAKINEYEVRDKSCLVLLDLDIRPIISMKMD